MMICTTDWVENIVENGENAGYQHFLFFPQCFQTFTFPNNPCFLCVCGTGFLKTLWEKQKLLKEQFNLFPQCFLVLLFRRTFCHFLSDLKLFQFGRVYNLSLVKGLTHSHTMTPFDAPGKKPFGNTVGQGEIARNKQFLLFPQCFLPVLITFFHFRQI